MVGPYIGSISTELGCPRHVRYTPKRDRAADDRGSAAMNRLMYRSKLDGYSITSSARAPLKANKGGISGGPGHRRRTAIADARLVQQVDIAR
jgi:hypothetical protein